MKDTWFKIENKEEAVEVQILEEIGGWGISGQSFMSELKEKAGDKPVNLLINSPGGSVIEGTFIYNELTKLKNTLNVEISGMAASMASIIAMAADKVTIHENSYLMIHNPWTLAMGDSDELRKMADLMDGMKDSAIKAYQRHAKELSAEKISEMMDAETWLDGLEAVAMGFAEEMLEPLEIAAVAKEIPECVKALVIADAEPKEELDESDDTTDEPDESEELPVEKIGNEDDAVIDGEATEVVDTEEEPETTTDGGDVVNIEFESKLSKQSETIKSLQSERDKLRSELEKMKTECQETVDLMSKEVAEMKQRLGKVSAPGFSYTEDSGFKTFRDALNELGYEEARKQCPELYQQFMANTKR